MSYQITPTLSAHNPLLKKYSPLVAQLLKNRNIHNENDAELFINPNYEDNHSPLLLSGMEKTIERIYTALQKKEKITIYADYDADGIPGAIILAELFEKINYSHYEIYIPHRHDEGYGVHIDALEEIKKQGTTLIITIDVGITAHEAGEWCMNNNIDLIITDHHLPNYDERGDELLPSCYTLINPKQKVCDYPDPMLCGCGVAFKLIQAFILLYGKHYSIPVGWEKWLLDMVGIATISDLVPLVQENRIFAYYGLKVIKKTKRKGLKQLIWDAGIDIKTLDETDIAFGITPKINAASRMSHPEDALAVFQAQSESEAKTHVGHLIRLNNERKKLVAQTMKQAYKKLSEHNNLKVIVIGSTDWQAGILGLVAAKLVEAFHVPVFVWSEENGVIKGSCRTSHGIHLVELMNSAEADSFIQFGGHAEAGGFSCQKNNIHFLAERLERALQIYEKDKENNDEILVTIDAELSLDDVNQKTFTEISRLAPFGVGNPRPLFLLKDIIPISVRQFGKTGEHIEIHFKNSEGKLIRALAFFKTEKDYSIQPKEGIRFNLLAYLEYSVFMGKHELRLHIVDCF